MPDAPLTRRDFLRLGAGAAAFTLAAGATPARAAVSSTGRPVTRVGLGTWRTFDVGGNAARRARLAAVLRAFAAGGGEVVDTSPMYGTSPDVLGDLVHETGLRDRLFLATKVWTPGRDAGERQLQEQLRRLRTDRVELLQVHNLVDWRTHLATLRGWKEAGRARYLGVTHYLPSAVDELSEIARREPIDFVQFAFSLAEPAAADRLLGICADRGIAFLGNRPFAEGAAFGRVRGKTLPPWAAELGIASWAQFLLQWILSHPQVTCTIPATSNPDHAAENMAAATGPRPDAAQRDRLAAHWRNL